MSVRRMKKPKRNTGCNLCEARRKADEEVFCMACGYVRFKRKKKIKGSIK